MAATFEWQLASILRPRENAPDVAFALIVLNQPLEDTKILQELWKRARVRVAADGGANRLYDLAKEVKKEANKSIYDSLDVIIGDLDSLQDDSRAFFTSTAPPTLVIHDEDQESTDFGKAIAWVRSSTSSHGNKPVDIVALGGIGGRIDQGLSQLHHLFLFQPGPGYEGGRVYLVSEESVTVLLKPGRHILHVRDQGDGEPKDVFDKYVGVLPIKEPSIITTKGLEWDVEDWPTSFGRRVSTSNHVLPDTKSVEVETSKEVLFTISLKGVK